MRLGNNDNYSPEELFRRWQDDYFSRVMTDSGLTQDDLAFDRNKLHFSWMSGADPIDCADAVMALWPEPPKFNTMTAAEFRSFLRRRRAEHSW